jgi:hypothetical protein
MSRRLSAATGALLSLLLTAPAKSEPPAPEAAPGGTVVLRGSTQANATSQLPPPGPSNPLSTGAAPPPGPRPAYGWDAGGFDRQFDRSGLNPQ